MNTVVYRFLNNHVQNIKKILKKEKRKKGKKICQIRTLTLKSFGYFKGEVVIIRRFEKKLIKKVSYNSQRNILEGEIF